MKNKRLILIIIIVVSALVCIGAAGYLVFENIINGQSRNDYNNLANSYASGVNDIDSYRPTEGASGVELVDNPIDFDSLYKKNTDIYSWIIIPNTNVNYPVLQSDKNDNFYLDHGVDKNYRFAGAIYSQVCNSIDYLDRVTVLYGHNMLDGSMFADLHKYADKEFFDKNRYIYVYTPERKLTYEIVSAFLYDDRHIMNSFDFDDDKVFQDYLDSVLNPRSLNSNVKEEITLDIDDKLLVLSTCPNYASGRYLVQGVLINDEQTKWRSFRGSKCF